LVCGFGFVLLAALVQGGLTATWDLSGLREAERLRAPSLSTVMQVVSFVGSGNALFPIGLALGAWFWRRRSARVGAFYLGTTASGWLFYILLKFLFARPRPTLISHLDGAGWWSFPSGHAMGSVMVLGLGTILLVEGFRGRAAAWLTRALVTALIVAIAGSRVYLGVHYPSDVVAGLLAGGAWIGGALAALRGGPGPASNG
jgi:undecaprenyl-diphosphatase